MLLTSYAASTILDSVISWPAMASSVYVQDISDDPDEVRATLSTGISVNHMITILIALFGVDLADPGHRDPVHASLPCWHQQRLCSHHQNEKALREGGLFHESTVHWRHRHHITEISQLCIKQGWDLTLFNRGNSSSFVPEGAKVIRGDIHDEAAVRALLGHECYDVVADFIAYTPEDVARDIRLFSGRTAQYFFISSASAYQKPLSSPWITEGTPLHNPYWLYSSNKAACEKLLREAYDEAGFPITIIRPSHTYCERGVPLAFNGTKGSFQNLERIRQGKPVIVPGDGTTLWTLTHSRDFAVAFVGLMGNCYALGETFHITSTSLTWNQIYGCVARPEERSSNDAHRKRNLGLLWPDKRGSWSGTNPTR